ncbi:MAG: hypothetical protein ULS35scaffold63_41 [Phage 33_17]|nr:MAG: hypothetical protein ULS35scaffold63_41 [Phage 33_17]
MNMVNFLSNILDYGFNLISIGLLGAFKWAFSQINRLNIKQATLHATFDSELKAINSQLSRIDNGLEKLSQSMNKKEDVELIKAMLEQMRNNFKKKR